MKSTVILILLCCFAPLFLSGQDLIPQDGTIEHNDKERPCLQVTIDPEPKTLKEAWRDYLKDELKDKEERLQKVRKQLSEL